MQPLPILGAALASITTLAAQLPTQFASRTEGGSTVTSNGRAADFDGDGSVDLLLAIDGELRLLSNDGAGGLAPTTVMTLASVLDIEVGDLDGDGDQDAYVVTNSTTSGTPWFVLRNDGMGSFTVEPIAAATRLLNDVHLSDLDSDGDLDVVQVGILAEFEAHMNDGAGNFVLQPGILPAVPLGISSPMIVGDFNGDGRDDFLLPSTAPSLVLSTPAGFTVRTAPPNTASARGTAADFNGDGWLDAFAINNSSTTVLFGDGSGGFTPGPNTPLPAGILRLATGDFDEDGDVDMLGTDFGIGTSPPLFFFANDGRGGFTDLTSQRLPAGDDVGSLPIAADLDGDGDLDAYVGASQFFVSPAQDRVLINRHVQVEVTGAVRIGGSLDLECASRPGYGTGLDLALVVVGTEATIPLPTPFGDVHVDAAGSISLPFVSLPASNGIGQLTDPVPNNAALLGLELAAQALIVDVLGNASPRLTNFARFRVVQ